MFIKKSAHPFISLVAISAVHGALAANSSSTAKQVVTDYMRPLSFEPNRGQADSQIDFWRVELHTISPYRMPRR